MKKMLYVMGIDWDWIYQRPQIIAEFLSDDFELTVVYPYEFWKRFDKKNDKKKGIRYQKVWKFPLERKNKIIGYIASIYRMLFFKTFCDYDYIFFENPIYTKYLLNNNSGKVFYDCIDNHAEISVHADEKKLVIEEEEVLIRKSDRIFASSEFLRKRIENHYPSIDVILVKNALKEEFHYQVKKACFKEKYKIGYIGTVAEWFDFEAINMVAASNEVLEIHIAGPLKVGFQKGNTIIYDGIIKHDKIMNYAEQFDCLIMPFVVCQTVVAVDPVKLYEYIALGKCIVSVYYEELEPFKNFVYFYNSTEELIEILERLSREGFPPKYSGEEQQLFIESNSWSKRYEIIRNAILE